MNLQEFKKYLEESKAENLIQENKTNKRLQKTSQDKLIRLTAELALSKCGEYPSANEKEIFAKQLIYSFPYLKYHDSAKPNIVSSKLSYKSSYILCFNNFHISVHGIQPRKRRIVGPSSEKYAG